VRDEGDLLNICNWRLATGSWQLATGSWQLAIFQLKFSHWDVI